MYALKIKTRYHVRVEIIKNKKRRGKNYRAEKGNL